MIIFSKHAIEQNNKRKIPAEFIYQTVETPEKTINSIKGRKLLQKSFGDKILEVVIVE
jgi:hypothetical protein